MGKTQIGIGFIGFGTVGQGVWKHLLGQREELESRLGIKISIPRIAVRDIRRHRKESVPRELLTTDPMEVVNDPNIDIVCELMGGTTKAKDYTLAALKKGKVVVTANKALIYEFGRELFDAVKNFGGHYYFEAAVAGGIPIIKTLREGLVANHFESIAGIVNGTCNYILSRMESEGKSYEDVLADAKRLGYVEADDRLDLDGWDSFHKAVILAFLAHGKWVSARDAIVEGIRNVTLEDMRRAREFGYRIKLICLIRRNFSSGVLSVGVFPALIPLDNTLARVDGVYNAIKLFGDVAGTTTLIGRGAGQDATSSAVISDIVDATIGIRDDAHKFLTPSDIDACYRLGESARMATDDEICSKFYLRLSILDEPGTLVGMYQVIAKHGVSVARVTTYEHPGQHRGTITLATYPTSEAVMDRVVADLNDLPQILAAPLVLRIYEPVHE